MIVRFVPGGVLKLSLASQNAAYAVFLEVLPYIAFYSGSLRLEELQRSEANPLFIIAVQRSAYSHGRWGRLLYRVPKEHLPGIPAFFRQNPMDLSDCEIVTASGESRSASQEECVGLERSAVWSAEHVESRLEDHYANRQNAFLESMKLKL